MPGKISSANNQPEVQIRGKPAANNRKKYLCLVLISASGVLFSLILFHRLIQFEQARIRSAFDDVASHHFNIIKDTLEESVSSLRSFGDFYASSHTIEWDEFDTFSRGIFSRQPYIFEFRWLKGVASEKRKAFEDSLRSQLGEDFQIFDSDGNGRFIRAAVRPEYFPIFYYSVSGFHQPKHKSVIGLDAAGFAERWKAMQLARDTADIAAIQPISCPGEEGVNNVMRMFLPIYANGLSHNTLAERRDNLGGFVAMLFQVDQLFSERLKNVRPAGVDISFFTEPGKKIPFYFLPSRTRSQPIDYSQLKNTSPISWSRSIKSTNQEWLLVCTPSPAFLKSHKIIMSWIVLWLGLMLTSLLALYLRQIINRKEQVELLVGQRTEELCKLSLVVEQGPALVVITDADGAIEYVNRKFIELTGYTLAEVKGKNPRLLKSGEQPPGFYNELWDTIKSGKEWRGQFHNKKKNGELYWERAMISPLRDEKGEIINFIAIKEDATELKKAEDELKLAKENLEIKAQDLVRANEELKKLDQLKSDFVSMVSHELRTPLSIMKESISQVYEGMHGEIPSKQKHFLSMSISGINRITHIVEGLLDISRIESGKFQLNKEMMDLVELAGATAASFKIVLQKKGLKLIEVFPAGKVEVFADRDKLAQVLVNLLGNAVKFTEQGQIEFKIEEKDGSIECSVADTGVGISPENLPRLFSKFEQFNKEITLNRGGIGLGLNISKSIIELHAGKIWAESKAGEGTKITFSLPKK